MYLSWDGPKLTGRQVFDRYWDLAEELGRDRNPYRLAFLQVVAVSETDERAEKEYGKHLEAHYRLGLGAIPHTAMAVPGYAEPAAIEGMLRSSGPAGMLSRMKTAAYSEIVDSQVAIVGSPATVADQIEALVREFRIGNLLVMLQNGSMPRDLTEKQATWSVGCTTKFAWPIADHGLGRRLHRVEVPTLIVWGREDALVPVEYAKEFGRRIAGSRVEVLDDCGHVVQADQPERSWAAISGFLAGEGPVRATGA